MLKEILETRFMVKREMKLSQHDKSSSSSVLKRVLEARQLAIKLLANVTYGYTAASFSGRMPMSELADAIVQSGRSTLEWTKKVVESNPLWMPCKVVYGDTDSIFVHMPGRSKEEVYIYLNMYIYLYINVHIFIYIFMYEYKKCYIC
jgi:DNA polymerase zeta